MRQQTRSVLKGAFAGLIGGLAGAGAKAIAEHAFPPRSKDQPSPPVMLAEQVAGHRLPKQKQRVAMHCIHWGFGALAGAIYGAISEFEPSVTAWRGAAFGITLNKLTHESLLPRMGLSAPAEVQPSRERASKWATHAIYGVVTDVVRRAVRHSL